MLANFDLGTWITLSLIALSAITAGLYAMSRFAERERKVIELHLQVHSLRVQYAERLAELAARELGGVQVVEPIKSRHAA